MQSGQTIAGKYRLNQPIGAGGMASVWSATNLFTERHFAIKFLHPAVAKTPEAARRFLMEAKVSARVNHPNIIDIIDVGQAEDGSLFMVMELLTGVSLETAMRRQSLPMLLSEFVGVMIDVGRALAAAHRNSVVHRDLKPTNIYLHMIREGVAIPKLLDFGVSKFLEEENHALTVAGTVLGSPLYMSPEQAMGMDGIDGRTDVFAFGAILFEGLCGYRAFDASNFNALIVMIATKPPKSIDVCAPYVPESLRSVVRDCMVTDRKKRIANFDEIVDRLLTALPDLEQSGLRLPSPVVVGPPSDPDATNALPVLRASEHPPHGAHHSQTPGVHISSPPSALQKGSATVPPVSAGASPPEAFSSPWDQRGAITVVRPPPVALFIGLGAVIAVAAIGIIALVARGIAPYPVSSATQPRTAAAAATPSAQPGTMAPPQAAAPPVASDDINIDEPPSVNVDSLPQAVKQPGKGLGRVMVAATSGWCSVTVDGTARGPTPTGPINLPTGSHQVQCTTLSGKTKSANIVVNDGATLRVKIDPN